MTDGQVLLRQTYSDMAERYAVTFADPTPSARPGSTWTSVVGAIRCRPSGRGERGYLAVTAAERSVP